MHKYQLLMPSTVLQLWTFSRRGPFLGPPCAERSVDVVSTAGMIDHSAIAQAFRILMSCCNAVWAFDCCTCCVHGFQTILVLVATAW